MSYIRTRKGNIYKTLDECMQADLPKTKLRVENIKMGWHAITYKSNIIKQADTIEELCDLSVFILSDGFHQLNSLEWRTIGEWLTAYKINGLKIKEVYGAIWTDKGLIYIAKMNKEGKLEVL